MFFILIFHFNGRIRCENVSEPYGDSYPKNIFNLRLSPRSAGI